MYTDWFVGAVSFALGCAALWGAVSLHERVWELSKLRWLERTLGRNAARLVIALLGIVLMVLGVAIALGWNMRWEGGRPDPRETVHLVIR